MNIILFDDQNKLNLQPFSFTRPVAEIRIGILTIQEKWKHYLPDAKISYLTREYLQTKFPLITSDDNIWINAALLPNAELLVKLQFLEKGQSLSSNDILMMKRSVNIDDQCNDEQISIEKSYLSAPHQIFSLNDHELRKDFELLTRNKKSLKLNNSNTLIGDEQYLFIEEGAVVNAAILNVSTGPIYIAKDAEVMEGSMIRGPFYLGEHSQTKMGTKIYGATTIGPYSKVGGELNNVVIFGYSNKAHDGFIGNAVIGEWCNIGADSNNSNLKNNYAEVKLWSYVSNNFKKTGLQFCGLMMGDHAKCGINTMFNTGTVVGVASNVFGSGFPRNFIPDFSWGGAQGMEEFAINKAFEVAAKVFERRGLDFNQVEKDILLNVFELTKEYRKNYE
jgi:UDP-N-acetylglucosamine diphosphorylase/glucosamine-1-phosphate N-acetyltransferase